MSTMDGGTGIVEYDHYKRDCVEYDKKRACDQNWNLFINKCVGMTDHCTLNLNETLLTAHRISVQLTHIPAPIDLEKRQQL